MTAGTFLHIPNTFTDDRSSSAMFVYANTTSPMCSWIQYSEYTESPTTDVVLVGEPPECSGCDVRIPNKTVFEAASSSSRDRSIVYSEYKSDDNRTGSWLGCKYSEYGDRRRPNGGHQAPFSICCNNWYSEYGDRSTLADQSVSEDTLDAGMCSQDIYSEYKIPSNSHFEFDDPIILNIWISFR